MSQSKQHTVALGYHTLLLSGSDWCRLCVCNVLYVSVNELWFLSTKCWRCSKKCMTVWHQQFSESVRQQLPRCWKVNRHWRLLLWFWKVDVFPTSNWASVALIIYSPDILPFLATHHECHYGHHQPTYCFNKCSWSTLKWFMSDRTKEISECPTFYLNTCSSKIGLGKINK